MRAPWLVLVESNTTPSGPEFPRAARRLGLEPILLAARPARYPWAQDQAIESWAVDTSVAKEVERACARLERQRPIAGVMSSSDRFLIVAAEVALGRRLPGLPPRALERCRDKRRQRGLLRRAGVCQPRSISVSSPAQARRAAALIGTPVVVKPADGTGSVGVRLCGDLTEVADQAAVLLGDRSDGRPLARLSTVLVEELVSGPEVSIETFGLQVVGVTAKHLGALPHFVEVGHDFPAPLCKARAEEPARSALLALRALGLGWGPAHTEVRLGARGATLIEVNPRLGGGNIPRLVMLAVGLDLVEATVALFSERLGRRTGRLPRGGRPTEPVAGASIRFLIPEYPGRLRRVEGLEDARSTPGVVEVSVRAGPGDRLDVTGSFRDRVGHVVAVGSSVAESASAAGRGQSALRLVIEEEARSEQGLLRRRLPTTGAS